MQDPKVATKFLAALGYSPDTTGLEIRMFPDDKRINLPTKQLWPVVGTPVWPEVVEANEAGYGVFVGVNPRSTQSGSTESIKEARALYTDMDGKDFDIDDVQRGKELALDRLHTSLPDFLQPSIIVDSGYGVHCVPLNTEILTFGGWKKYNEVIVGETVLGYNQKSKTLEWTQILGILTKENDELVRFGNKRFSVVCTPKHRWIGLKHYWDRPTGVWGSGACNGKRIKRTQELMQGTNEISRHNNTIKLSAPMGTVLFPIPISEDEAELIGWFAAEGSWGEGNKSVRLSQKEGIYSERIRRLLKDIPHTEGRWHKSQPEIITWLIQKASFVELWSRCGMGESRKHTADWSSFVLRLSNEARAAFLEGMFNGDGTYNRKNKLICQNRGKIADAISIAILLEGKTPRIAHARNLTTTIRFGAPIVGWELYASKIDDGPVWCPQTNLGTWVMRQGDTICITGNCYWLLDEPIPLDDIHFAGRYKETLRAIAAHLNGDRAATDVARVLRLPGTDNCKSERRMPVLLVECHPERNVSVSDFEGWLVTPNDDVETKRTDRETLTVDQIRDRIGRNNALTSLAGSLRRRGISDEVILASITAQNDRFDTPLPYNELQQIAKSVARYKPDPHVSDNGNSNVRPEQSSPQTRNPDLERLLIASILQGRGTAMAMVCQSLQEDDLSDAACSMVFNLMQTMYQEGIVVDSATTIARLKRAGELAITLSVTEWLKTEDITTEHESIRTYANMLLEMAQTRRLMGAADEMNAAALNLPPDKAQEYSLTLLQDLSMRKNRQESGDVLDALRKADAKKPNGFTTGMEAYDAWARGFWGGAYHTIGGYRGTGKTGFMLGRMYDAAMAGARCCYFSNETPVHMLVDRLRGYAVNVDWRLISMAKDAGSPRWGSKQDATEKLMQLRDTGRMYLFDRQRSIASIRMMVLLKRPDVIFVDYIQHLTAGGGSKQKEYDRITECSLALQEMANQENVCVVAGSQLAVAQAREGFDGEVTEFKGSGSIIADSTIAILLIRDKKTEGETQMARIKLAVKVIKNQVGLDNVQVEFLYDPATARLTRISGEPVTASQKETWWTK